MLRFGSTGAPVMRLQKALNIDPQKDRTLTEDGIFGGQTQGRVQQFQGRAGTMADGIVGPITMGLLQHLFAVLDKLGGGGGGGGSGGGHDIYEEVEKRAAIVAAAQAALLALGWQDEKHPPKERMPQICTRFMNDETAGRERQGGKALVQIFRAAGLPNADVALHVGAGMARRRRPVDGVLDECTESHYNQNRNTKDIPAWCGIFALAMVRTAGLTVPGWPNGNVMANTGFTHIPPAAVRAGDIGIAMKNNRNHHFVVINREGATLTAIDGNAGILRCIRQQTYTMMAPDSTHVARSTVISPRKGAEPTVFFAPFS